MEDSVWSTSAEYLRSIIRMYLLRRYVKHSVTLALYSVYGVLRMEARNGPTDNHAVMDSAWSAARRPGGGSSKPPRRSGKRERRTP